MEATFADTYTGPLWPSAQMPKSSHDRGSIMKEEPKFTSKSRCEHITKRDPVGYVKIYVKLAYPLKYHRGLIQNCKCVHGTS